MKPLTIVVLLTVAIVLTAGQNIDDCLKQDSISCVQKALYKRAKELLGKDSLELLSGVSLVKSNADSRSLRSSKQLGYDHDMDSANDVVERQNALETFMGDAVEQFLTGRSLRINFTPAFEKINESARAISESMPQEIRQAVNEVVEGRGKKKIMKQIMPLLVAAKVKLGTIMTLAYFGIGLIAKKAILASLISLGISAFLGLKALWASKQSSYDVTSYNSGWSTPIGAWVNPVANGWSGQVTNAGWAAGGSAGWEDPQTYAQNQAYAGYHQ